MLNSQLHVDLNVNAGLIVADEWHPQYHGMAEETPFQQRFRAVIAHLGAKSSTGLAKKLGVTDNPNAVAWNWFNREGRLPEAYRKPLNKLGVSIDWLNAGDGKMVVGIPSHTQSQAGGLNAEKLADLLETVEAAIAQSGRQVPVRTKARLVAALYGDEQASAAGSAQAVQAALASILATLE